MGEVIQPIPYPSKGLMGHILDSLIPDEGAVELENYMWMKGWERRNGLIDVESAVPDFGRVIALFLWERTGGASFVVAQTSLGNIYAYNLNTLAWTPALATGLTTVGSFASYSNNILGDRVYWSNGVEDFRSWTSTGAMTLYPTAPKGRLLAVHADSMWMAYSDAYPERVWRSQPGDPTVWDANAWIDVGRPADRSITAIVSFQDLLVVFKSASYYVIYDPIEYANRLVDPSKGCVGERAWVTNGPNMLFVSRDGIVQYDPNGPGEIISTQLGHHFSDAIDFRRHSTTLEVEVCGYNCGSSMGFGLGPSGLDPVVKQLEWFPYAPGKPWVRQTRPAWLFADRPHAITAVDVSGNEIQTIRVTGVVEGTFQLTFGTGPTAETTGLIPYNATAATIKTALEALSSILVGDIVVTGGPVNTADVTVTFQGTYVGVNVPLLVGSTPNLITNIADEHVTVLLSNTNVGSFKLLVLGNWTGTIPWDATAAQLKTILEALPNVEPGDVNVTLDSTGTYRIWSIYFIGGYHGVNIPVLQLQDTGLGNTVYPYGHGWSIATLTEGSTTFGTSANLPITLVQDGFTVTHDTGKDEVWCTEYLSGSSRPPLLKHQPGMDAAGFGGNDGGTSANGPYSYVCRFVSPWFTFDMPNIQKTLQHLRIMDGTDVNPDNVSIRVESEQGTSLPGVYTNGVKRLDYDSHGYRHRVIIESSSIDHVLPSGIAIGQTQGSP